MRLSDIARLRLVSQHLSRQRLKTPAELVSWMGAMQAQDAEMAKWAIGVRLYGTTRNTVEAAMDRGEILRTHVLRPTWHVVAVVDIRRMIELSAPRIHAAMRARHRQLGLTPTAVEKSMAIIERTLSRGPKARGDVVDELKRAGFRTNDNRMAHLLIIAEIEGLVCSGPLVNGKTTYALMDERAPKSKRLDKDTSLAELATRYFISRGPATVVDFCWWSGLTAGDSRAAVEMIKRRVSMATVNGTDYYYKPGLEDVKVEDAEVRLLPAYDEFTIAYRNRSAALGKADIRKAASSNGIFWPLVTHGGRAVGTWKRAQRGSRTVVEFSPFVSIPVGLKKGIRHAVERYSAFLGEEVTT